MIDFLKGSRLRTHHHSRIVCNEAHTASVHATKSYQYILRKVWHQLKEISEGVVVVTKKSNWQQRRDEVVSDELKKKAKEEKQSRFILFQIKNTISSNYNYNDNDNDNYNFNFNFSQGFFFL